jgi:Kelch motif
LKPLYPDRPFDSGTNVKQLELYDPATGEWTLLPESANRSLPLFPRLHLLPNGHVYYDVAGQSFNPFGQAYDEAFWNLAATFDPAANRWSDLGIPGLTAGSPDVGFGFRGSTFSMMLPLEPDASGDYTEASFLTAGGTPSAVAPSPGTPLGTNLSRIDTVTIGANGSETLTSESTGPLGTARWYPSGVLLPTGEVMAFSGADIDEVQAPSLGRPVKQAELYDPETKTWSPVATAARPQHRDPAPRRARARRRPRADLDRVPVEHRGAGRQPEPRSRSHLRDL